MITGFLVPACATCISQEGQVTTLAANGAVYVMFVVLALVFGCFAAVILTFVRRNKKFTETAAAAGGGPV